MKMPKYSKAKGKYIIKSKNQDTNANIVPESNTSMIKITENDRRIFENELKIILNDVNDYLDGLKPHLKSTKIHVEDLLDYFESSGNPKLMRMDTVQLFKRKDKN